MGKFGGGKSKNEWRMRKVKRNWIKGWLLGGGGKRVRGGGIGVMVGCGVGFI